MVLMTPQLEKIVWNGARTTGNPVYPQGGSSLFHFISENEIIYILMYFIETRQLGLEPESARKDKQTSNKISNKLPVRALNKLLKTQAGDISPYFLRELIAIMRT